MGKCACRVAQLICNRCRRQLVLTDASGRQVHQGLTGQYKDILTTYWQHTINHLESDSHDYKLHQLPLARIKKVMKADPEVKMISAEAPILFAKGCDIFITELTMRAWIHAEENKRRTLQRSDIASALSKSDMFDFLIDIVPREEASSHAKRTTGQSNSGAAMSATPAGTSQIPGKKSTMCANFDSFLWPLT
jgi:nuclear transcription factor Y, gamma